MKISINNSEALKIVKDHFSSKFPTEILEIEITPVAVTMNDSADTVLNKIARLSYLGHQKLEAIKLLRGAVTGIGLFDAKVAIENFDDYRGECERVGHLIYGWRQTGAAPEGLTFYK